MEEDAIADGEAIQFDVVQVVRKMDVKATHEKAKKHAEKRFMNVLAQQETALLNEELAVERVALKQQGVRQGFKASEAHEASQDMLGNEFLDESYHRMWKQLEARDPEDALQEKFGATYVSRLRFVRAGRLRPLGREELELLRRTARLASIDNSCPACHHARAPARRMPWFSPAANRPVRSGMTSDLRIPQPECGHVSSLRELSAPLFMAAEWPRRLIKENAPYGLRMRGKTEEQMLTRLREYHRNVSQPVRCRYETCAVVGSSGNLRGKQYGQLIDAHEAVFRVNAAPVHRHEEAVGARTTWRFMNSEKPFFMASLGVPELQVVICHMGWIGSCQRQAFGGAYMETIAYVNPIFYGQLWSMLGRPVGKQTPSTGLLAIALALGVCIIGNVRSGGNTTTLDIPFMIGLPRKGCAIAGFKLA
ncbi:MAG: hypothetical protein SGPRY_002787 [Prymnesium sp.]